MKKLTIFLSLLALTACNNGAIDDQVTAVEEPISLNAVQQSKKEVESSEGTMKEKLEMLKKQTQEIALTVPDSTWSMKIHEVLETDTEVAVIVQLSQQTGMIGMQVISELVTSIEFESAKPAKVYVLGKTWGWENTEKYQFVKDISNICLLYTSPSPRDS